MKTLKEKIEVMQAAEDGKVIERKDGEGWEYIPNYLFDWINEDYRIKPEPMEFLVKIYEKGNMLLGIEANPENNDMFNAGIYLRTIKVREVTE